MEQADLDEDSRQALLVALNCPCCGAGGMNYTAKVVGLRSFPVHAASTRKKKPQSAASRLFDGDAASISILKP